MPEQTVIEVRHDKQRGCGWRKPGGLYLVSEGPLGGCGKLPIPLETCPCCGHGLKASRGWQWVDADALTAPYKCPREKTDGCCRCPLGGKIGRAGLLWIGGVYYKTPEDFAREATTHGLSRRISRVPRGFIPGKTYVLTAHRAAITETCPECKGNGGKFGKPVCDACDSTGVVVKQGIFGVFLPTAVEYVVTGKETEEELCALVGRGITPVRIERDEEDVLLQEAARKKAADEAVAKAEIADEAESHGIDMGDDPEA
jgi:hypothetical protein